MRLAAEAEAEADTEVLLALLNSRPLLDGVERDELADGRRARRWARSRGGLGSAAELDRVRDVRDRVRAVVLEEEPPSVLGDVLDGVYRVPRVGAHGVDWELVAEPEARLAVRIVLAWAWAAEHLPGRLRPCGNDECRLFLLDRSRANRARWCSMATCGNRMKARRHYDRARTPREE